MQDDQSAILQLNEAARYQIAYVKRNAAQASATRLRDVIDIFASHPSPSNLRSLNSAFAAAFRVFNALDPMPEPPTSRADAGDLRKVA
jgi:hypothetical protein